MEPRRGGSPETDLGGEHFFALQEQCLNQRIPFNRPYIGGKELFYIAKAVALGNIGGDGHFTRECSRFIEERFSIEQALMVPSCTAALEMAAMLCDLGPGDEVITSPFSFVASANAAIYEGARPVFADIDPMTLNLDPEAAWYDRVRRHLEECVDTVAASHGSNLPAEAMAPILASQVCLWLAKELGGLIRDPGGDWFEATDWLEFNPV